MTAGDVVQWLTVLFEEPAGSLSPATTRDQVSGWDSLGVLTLMAEMDEKFGIALTEADIKSLQSVGDVVAFLQRHGKIA